MARVTVEDCVTEIPNRFELVMAAAQRCRNIGAGSPMTLDRDNDKLPVIALREIAARKLDLKGLEDDLVKSHQRVIETEETDQDLLEFMEGEENYMPPEAANLDEDDLAAMMADAGFSEMGGDDELADEVDEAVAEA